jgi:hypothetical protein
MFSPSAVNSSAVRRRLPLRAPVCASSRIGQPTLTLMRPPLIRSSSGSIRQNRWM